MLRSKTRPRKRLKKPKGKNVVLNKKRKERYDCDVTFREEQKRRSRRTYRKAHEVELENCLHSLKFLPDLAGPEQEVITSDDKYIKCQALTIQNTALAMQKLYPTVWRWINKGQLPEPALRLPVADERSGKDGRGVYHIDEVRVFIEEIGAHEMNVAYYRRDHTEVRDRVFERVSKLRSKLKL